MRAFTTVQPCQANILIEEIKKRTSIKTINGIELAGFCPLSCVLRGTINLYIEKNGLSWIEASLDQCTDAEEMRPDRFLRHVLSVAPSAEVMMAATERALMPDPKNIKQLGLAF